MATIKYAIKQMEKLGTVIENNGFFTVQFNGYDLEVSKNGTYDEIATIYLKKSSMNDDLMTDYHAGSFYKNIGQAIKSIAIC
jgi:hypothetical protein